MIGLLDRWGDAVVAPARAMRDADGAEVGGRPGIDLAAAVLLAILVAHTRGVVGAAWIGVELGPRAAVASLVAVVTSAATVPLVVVAIAAIVVWLGAGARRELGRDADLACVAALPPTLVAVVLTTLARTWAPPSPVPLVLVAAAAVPAVIAAVRIARARGGTP